MPKPARIPAQQLIDIVQYGEESCFTRNDDGTIERRPARLTFAAHAHRAAMLRPKPKETPLLEMLRGLAGVADAVYDATGKSIADTDAAPDWAACGQGLIGLCKVLPEEAHGRLIVEEVVGAARRVLANEGLLERQPISVPVTKNAARKSVDIKA